jgi:MMP endo-(1,4)-3-O-methyl-alpha-D-mannosidase
VTAPAAREARDERALSDRAFAATVDAIARVQLPDGNIPWFPGGHTDPWNMVEAAMALDVGGRHEAARAAYLWLARRQRADGGWHRYYQGDEIEDAALDTNVAGYVATGIWHHVLATGDRPFLRDRWESIEAALTFVLGQQQSTGAIAWRADDPEDGALLTASSSLHGSVRCGVAIADAVGHRRQDWERSLRALAHAIARRPDAFLDKRRWAMDWYYPVLGGVVAGREAHRRLRARWTEFVVRGRGVRCVADRPWVTAAETCELVLTLEAIGLRRDARRCFDDVQFLRAEGGGYWTGANFEDEDFHGSCGELFPREQPTWNSAAVVLAAHALDGSDPTASFFRSHFGARGARPLEITSP